MRTLERHFAARLAIALRFRVLICVGMAVLCSARALAQESAVPPLRLGSVVPGGVRTSATESWGVYECEVTNLTNQDRQGRVYLFYPGQPEVQFGREVWLPAHATISTWILAGPPGLPSAAPSCEILALLAETSGRQERLFLPTKERPLISRRVLYRSRELATAILLDDEDVPPPAHGELPRPDSRSDEALRLARTLRAATSQSEFIHIVRPGALPVSAEAFAGIDQFILASSRIARDPAGMRALRHWLQQGGRVWVLLDMVESDLLDGLLGESLDFQVVDRTSVTTTHLQIRALARSQIQPPVQHHERAVEFVRVVLPPDEKVAHTVNGWPAWITRSVGRGKVVFTTLGPRAWYRPRARTDGPSPYMNHPALPVATLPLEAIAQELQPGAEEDPLRVDSLRPLLSDDIGYSVVGRGTVLPVFVGFLLFAVLLGLAMKKLGRPDVLGWMIPAATLGATAAFLVLGEWSRGAARPTVAVVQIIDADTGTDEAAVHGLLAAYRPDSGPAPLGVERGGFFDLDMEGIEGQTRRLLLTDLDSWHWDNLALPSGVRLASFRSTVSTGVPLAAVAHFGVDGIEGTLRAGNFEDLGDALLTASSGRNMAVRLRPDGAFLTGSADVLPRGQFLAGRVLSDRQQRRQDVFRELLQGSATGRLEGRNALLVWAKPLNMHFTLGPDARTSGNALLLFPLRLERSAAGQRVTVPGPFIPYQRILATGPSRPALESSHPTDMHLRFQLPAEALPLQIEEARLIARIDAPSRRVVIAGRDKAELVELRRVDSPKDAIRLSIADARLLNLDAQGGLHLNLSISDEFSALGHQQDAREINEKWTIEELELEVVGTMAE